MELYVPIRDVSGGGPPLTGEVIDDLEMELGFELPVEYRNFLLKHNGGVPEPPYFPMGETNSSELAHFYCVGGDEPSYDVGPLTKSQRGSEIPPELMPIGIDAGGNDICLGVLGRRRGKVYFLDHEIGAIRGGKPTYANVRRIAGSFSKFIKSFRELP